jgi:Uncharacterised nucleotidyltransferase
VSGAAIWSAIDRLVDGKTEEQLEDLVAHRIHLLAARRWRELGRRVPPGVIQEERLAAWRTMAAPILLQRVRVTCARPLLVLKGPAAAAAYPDPALRPFKDLDLLCEDAGGAQRALLAEGFEPVGDPALYVGIHHERPLWLQGQPLVVEVHRRPKWPEGMTPPATEELFELAVPSPRLGVDSAFTLPPGPHAVLLAAHSWAHEPLRRLSELLDVATLVAGADRTELAGLAERWGVGRIWRTTLSAADALLSQAPNRTLPLRLWARNLDDVRERTVLESHLTRCLAGYWARPPATAFCSMLSAATREVRPDPGESWSTKLARTRRAFRNAFTRRSEHDTRWQHEVERLRERF